MANPAVAEKLVHQQQRLGLCLKTGLLIDISAKHVPSDYVRSCVRCRGQGPRAHIYGCLSYYTASFSTTIKRLKECLPLYCVYHIMVLKQGKFSTAKEIQKWVRYQETY